MNEQIETGDRYECVNPPYPVFTRNKIYNIKDVGDFIWLQSDDGQYRNFKKDWKDFGVNFKLIANKK